jgi:hypothetical protein
MYKCTNISDFMLKDVLCYSQNEDGGNIVPRNIYPNKVFYTPHEFIDRRIICDKVVESPPEEPVENASVEPKMNAQVVDEEDIGARTEILLKNKNRDEIMGIARGLAKAYEGEPFPHSRLKRPNLVKWVVAFVQRHPDTEI